MMEWPEESRQVTNEMPSCLLAFESSWPFIWGDCGNAQIFYKKNNVDGRLEFSFAWSCH